MDFKNKPRHAFGVDTPRDMLEKLNRELNRITNSSEREDLVDHANNFALTAWHITDWVWRAAFSKNPEGVVKILSPHPDLKSRFLQSKQRSRDLFTEALTQKCSGLAICQDICNGFKHVIASSPPDREAPGATFATATFSGTEKSFPQLIIGSENGEEVEAEKVFNAVIVFWTQFMDEWNL